MDTRATDAFVGRIHQLAALDDGLDAALAGRGTTVLLAGEAGIGKSRLASELAHRAADRGFEVLVGRSIDLVGTELPYQPFLDALRPVRTASPSVDSQLQVFEGTLALLRERAAAAPLVLLLEDLHWADTSTLDLVVFLAHNLADCRLVLLGTYRPDEFASTGRVQHLAERVQRSGTALLLELGPLGREELIDLLTSRAPAKLTRSLADAIVARSEGNPFFAEELLAVADDGRRELPRRVRDLLLQRVTRLDQPTQRLLRLIATAGRDVGYPLLSAVASAPERDLREPLRLAVEHGVLVADQASGSFRFRHALLAEAVYATILPGEREELHARLAEELTRSQTAEPAELAPHWTAAGRADEALVASIQAARQAETVFGLAEAVGDLERALSLWPSVPDAAHRVGLDLAELCSWTAELASRTGAAGRAVELARRAIELVGDGEPLRAALLYERLARYLHESGRADATLAALERAVAFVPAEPPSPDRARVLAALAHGLTLAWRHADALVVAEDAMALAQLTGAPAAEMRALAAAGWALAYLGRAEEGLALLWRTRELAEERGDPVALYRAYAFLTDVLTMLGRPREAARLGTVAIDQLRPYGIDNTTLTANRNEALLAVGDWDEADTASVAALRAITANYPHTSLLIRADLEVGRGRFDDARPRFVAARKTLRIDRDVATYQAYVAQFALWERRWTDAAQAVREGLRLAAADWGAPLRMWLCAQGLHANAELAALARISRDADSIDALLDEAGTLLSTARQSAVIALPVTANTDAWQIVAEAEYQRGHGTADPRPWAQAAAAWDRLERPPRAAYCRWRQAEACVASGAARSEASAPLREAYTVAVRIGAQPLIEEIERLAQRARLDLTSVDAPASSGHQSIELTLGLTPREAEVLTLIARGYTNREIAAALVISVKTASVHVSHILQKLGARNRLEAAAIAHRLTGPS